MVQRAPDNILCDTIHKLHDCVGANGDNTTQCKALMNSESVLSTDSSANCGADSPTLLPENKMPKYEMNETMEDMSGQLLKTFVVGRKFSEEVMLYPGANISLLRDPNNIKDSNAIKVWTLWPFHPLDLRFVNLFILRALHCLLELGCLCRIWML